MKISYSELPKLDAISNVLIASLGKGALPPAHIFRTQKGDSGK